MTLPELAEARYAVGDPTRKPHHYFKIYESVLAPLRDQEIEILELGISSGASLQIWKDYLPKANIVGLDIRPDTIEQIRPHLEQGRVAAVLGDQSSPASLADCLKLSRKGAFDIVIDDASHVGHLSKASFDYLMQDGLAPGGLYFIEDYGTSYIHDFYDGAPFDGHETIGKRFTSHQHGMVGWMKQLVDILHTPVLSPNRPQGAPIASVQFWPHIALVRKIA